MAGQANYELRITSYEFMDKHIFTVQIDGGSRFERVAELIRAAARVVSGLSEDTKEELLVKLVVHAILQDCGVDGKVDAVELLRDSGLYIGDEAKKRM